MDVRLSNFRFERNGYGHYKVTYISPKTGKTWTRTIDDMSLIDATKNEELPKQKDLFRLKYLVKFGY